jgi:AcrR family transcriptional regulator
VTEPSLRERKKQQTRTAIADAAAMLFSERGFHQVTVDEVASAAGVSKQTVFNHFATKEDLVFDRAAEVQELMVAAIRDRPPGTSLVAAFRALTQGFWMRIADLPGDRPQAGFFKIVHETPSLQAYTRELGARINDALTTVIAEEAGADAGDHRPRVVATALTSAHHSVLEAARGRIAAGEHPAGFVHEILARVNDAYDLLEHGLGDYGRR